VPGYFLASIIFRKRHHLAVYEKTALSVLLSLGINMLFGLALAYMQRFTTMNLWLGMISLSAVIIAAYLAVGRSERSIPSRISGAKKE